MDRKSWGHRRGGRAEDTDEGEELRTQTRGRAEDTDKEKSWGHRRVGRAEDTDEGKSWGHRRGEELRSCQKGAFWELVWNLLFNWSFKVRDWDSGVLGVNSIGEVKLRLQTRKIKSSINVNQLITDILNRLDFTLPHAVVWLCCCKPHINISCLIHLKNTDSKYSWLYIYK